MIAARRRLTGAYECARIQTLIAFTYRTDYLFNLVGLLLQVYLLRIVWTSVYGQRISVAGVTLPTQIAYATLGTLQYWLFNPWGFSMIPERVRTGKIGVDLMRPVPFLHQIVSSQIGLTAGLAPFALVTLPFAVLLGRAAGPVSTAAGAVYLVSLVFGYLLTILLASIMGMMTFWATEVSGTFMMYRMVTQFFSGALVPLWFMPGWLADLTHVLPFQATTYSPLAIYLGRVHGDAILTTLGVQVLWIVLSWLTLRLIWARALHRVVVQGG